MSIKMTRAEKCNKKFQEIYSKKISEGAKPSTALRETRKLLNP